MSILRQKLHSFFKIPLHHQYNENIILYNNFMNLTVDRTNTPLILSSSKSSHIDLLRLYIKSNHQWSKYISRFSAQFIIKTTTTQMHSTILKSNLFSEMLSEFMKKRSVDIVFFSLSTFCSKSFDISWIFSMISISK